MVDWFPDWSGSVAVVVASGQTAARAPLDVARGRCRCLVVNNSFRLAPWADALYAADRKWWETYSDAFAFAGLKITAREPILQRDVRVVNVRADSEAEGHDLHFEPLGMIGHGGNSGFQGFNLTLQFGSRKIVLVGFDLWGDHWHGRHELPLKNPYPQRLETWRRRLDAQAPRLHTRGIKVVNASEQSALLSFPKMPLLEALAYFGA